MSLPPDVHRLSLTTPYAIGRVNAYLLDGDPLTLVDTGPRLEETWSDLESAVADAGRRIEDVEVLVLTHQHMDHMGWASRVVERSGAEIAVMAPLSRVLADFDGAMERDDAYAVELMHLHGVPDDVARTLNEISVAYRRFGASAPAGRILGEGERLVLGGREWTVRARPGHSPTDTVLHDAEGRLLVAGDHLLEKISSNPVAHVPIETDDPVGAARSPQGPGPLRRYLASMGETAAMDVATVLPGHGEEFAGHAELIEKRKRMHRRRANKILREAEERPVTAVDIARTLWRRVPVAQQYLALSEVLGHLDLLLGEGAVEAVQEDGVVRWRRR